MLQSCNTRVILNKLSSLIDISNLYLSSTDIMCTILLDTTMYHFIVQICQTDRQTEHIIIVTGKIS